MPGSKKRDNEDVYAVPVGAPARGSLEFLKRVNPTNRRAKIRIDLPGDVVKVEGKYVLGIIPMVKINVGGNTPRTRRYIVASFAEQDASKTDKVLGPFFRSLIKKTPREYGITVESASLTFADLGPAVASRRYSVKSSAPVQMRTSIGLQGGERVESGAFPGSMVLAADKDTPGGEGDTHFLFDCHAHWHSVLGFNRYTYCHDTGPCPAPTRCLCDSTHDACRGYCWCTCK